MPDFSFKKGERLSSKKAISLLFQSGRSVASVPIKIIYNQSEMEQYPATVAISVPKRLFKKAVDRNLLKRRIREAYRLNKPEFYSNLRKNHMQLSLIILYQHREILDYKSIEKGVKMALDQVLQKLKKTM
ncbi:MAG: ribonuclease P protein component [Bacteroidota bacterium]